MWDYVDYPQLLRDARLSKAYTNCHGRFEIAQELMNMSNMMRIDAFAF